MKAELTWLSESRETSRVGKSLARFLRGCFQIARVCVCVPSSRGTERELMEAIVRVQRM